MLLLISHLKFLQKISPEINFFSNMMASYLFHAAGLFLDPLKTSENLWWKPQGVQKVISAIKWVDT